LLLGTVLGTSQVINNISLKYYLVSFAPVITCLRRLKQYLVSKIKEQKRRRRRRRRKIH
jgi:hypothetical protein